MPLFLDTTFPRRCGHRSIATAILFVSIGVSSAGCTNDTSAGGGAGVAGGAGTGAAGTSGTIAEPEPGSIDPCGLLTREEAEAAAGVELRFGDDASEVTESEGTLLGSCSFADTGGIFVTLGWTRWAKDVNTDAYIDSYFVSQSEQADLITEEIPAVDGHRASWAVYPGGESGGLLTIFMDLRNILTIGVSVDTDLDAQRQIALDVSALVLSRF